MNIASIKQIVTLSSVYSAKIASIRDLSSGTVVQQFNMKGGITC